MVRDKFRRSFCSPIFLKTLRQPGHQPAEIRPSHRTRHGLGGFSRVAHNDEFRVVYGVDLVERLLATINV